MKQKIFIGSSREGQAVCDALGAQLASRGLEAVPWHVSFPAARTAIDSLLHGLQTYNFGVFVMSADDHAEVRGKEAILPRDNVLFEAGLFMGMHGLHRTFLVCPADVKDFHLLTDVSGVTYVRYDPEASTMDIAVVSAANQIKQAIAQANTETPNVHIKVTLSGKSTNPTITWPLKLQLKIKNTLSVPVTVQSKKFTFGSARQATNNYVLGGSEHNVAFMRWFMMQGGKSHDQYHEVVYLVPGDEVEAWVAFDAMHTDDEMKTMHAQKELGAWAYRTTWHDPVPRAYDHEMVF